MIMNKSFFNLFMVLFLFMCISLIFFMNNNFIKWMILEMFTLMFIGLINYNNYYKISSLIYFLISSISSIMFFFMLILNLNYWNMFNLNLNFMLISNFMILLSLMVKIALFPFFKWMIYSFSLLSWFEIWIFSSMSKIIPIDLLSNLINFDLIFLILLILNSMMSSLLCLNEFSVKKIMGYSSMNHSTYLIYSSYVNSLMFMFYCLMYMFMMFMFIKILIFLDINMLKNSMNYLNFKKLNYLMILMILNYSMFPPLGSFIIKWFFFSEVTFFNENILIYLIFLIFSGLMIFIYLNMFNVFYIENKLMKKNLLNLNYYYYFWLNNNNIYIFILLIFLGFYYFLIMF